MRSSAASYTRTIVLAITFAMVAIVVGILNPNPAWAQASQEAACGPWNEPMAFSVPRGAKVSIGRVVEMTAEDLTSGQASQAHSPAQFPFQRLASRAPASSSVTTVAALVAAVYTGGDASVTANLVREITNTISHLGLTRISIEEGWLWCPMTDALTGAPIMDPATGRQRRVSPTSATCTDGLPPRQGARSRMLARSFAGDFYEGSTVAWVNHQAPPDYRAWRGYSLRVSIKSGAVSVPRVYDARQHPRPGAQLCRRLPEIAREAAHANSAAAQRAIFDEQSRLIAAAISEADLPVAIWATAFTAAVVNPTVARTDATAGCEARETELRAIISERDGTIRGRDGTIRGRDATIQNWKLIVSALAVSLAALLAALAGTIKYYRDEMKQVAASFQGAASAAVIKAVNEFWGSLRLNEVGLVVMERTPKGSPDHTRAGNFNTDTLPPAAANVEIAWLAATLRSVCVNVAPAAEAPKTIEPTPTPNAPAEPMLASDHLFGVTALACAMFFVLGQVSGSRLTAAAAQIEIKAQTRAGRRLATRLKKTRGLKEAATVAACEAQGARTEIMRLLIGAKILDAGIGEVPHDLAIASISHQIGVVGRVIASHDAEVGELISARNAALTRAGKAEREVFSIKEMNRGTAQVVNAFENRAVKAEGDVVLLRAFPESIWPEVFGQGLPEDHIPTGREIGEVMRRLRARRAETSPHPAAATTFETLDLSDEAAPEVLMVEASISDGFQSAAWRANNTALTRRFEVPRNLRRASNPLIHQTVMVPAAAAPEAMVHDALTVALPAANGGPTTAETPTVEQSAAPAIHRNKAPTSRMEAVRTRAPAPPVRPSTYFAWLLGPEAQPVNNEPLTAADMTPARMRRAAPSQPVPAANSSVVRATTPVYAGQPPQVFVASMLTPFAMPPLLRPPTPSGVVLISNIGAGTATPDAPADKAG